MANLIIGIMYVSEELLEKAKQDLIGLFGKIKIETSAYDFTKFTKYYEKEMGAKILKKFFIFEKPINKKDLVDVKKKITLVEGKYSVDDKRQVNLDPGFIDKNELTLASFKKGTNYKENLGDEVYAHTVLRFGDSAEVFWHTFPDYRENKEIFFTLSKV